jgi:chaperonin GroEL
MLQDIAILTGGQVISDDLGMQLKDTTMDMLGRAKSVKVAKDSTIIVDGEGTRSEIEERIAFLKRKADETTSDYDREKIIERVAKLGGGVAVIRIGAATETEMKEAKYRMEDALNATRAAVSEGIIAGGGSAYVHAQKAVIALADTLDGDEKTGARIVAKALEAPLRTIVENAGLEGAVVVNKVKEQEDGIGFDAIHETYVDMMETGIIDPVKVTKNALTNAVSISATLLTTEAAVGDIKEEKPEAAGNNMDMGY